MLPKYSISLINADLQFNILVMFSLYKSSILGFYSVQLSHTYAACAQGKFSKTYKNPPR